MFGSIQGARCAPRRFLTVAGCLLAALALLPTPASAALATGATITPSPADFGSVALGSTSVIEFSLTPDLGANYSVGTFGIVGVAPLQFHVLTGVGTTPCFVGFPAVGGDGTCNVTVQFAPTTPGLSSAQLVINDGASNSPQVATLTGFGTGGPTQSPPTIHVPSTVTAEATGPTGAVVTYLTSATSAGGLVLTPVCVPPSGSTFPLGSTTVTCTATDASGLQASASFAVAVLDTMPPVLTLPAAVTATATGPTGAAVSFAATAFDLVSGSVPVTCIPTSGSVFAVGPTVVHCSAADSHGNTANGNFTVSVARATPGLTYTGAITGEFGDPTTLAAVLQGPGGPIAGATVTFVLAGQTASAVTNAAGSASVILPAGAGPVLVSFAGNGWLAGTSQTSTFAVSADASVLTITSPASQSTGTGGVSVAAVLLDDAGAPIAGRNVVFTACTSHRGDSGDEERESTHGKSKVACTSVTAVTDTSGAAIAHLLLTPGKYLLTAAFTGDASYLASSATSAIAVNRGREQEISDAAGEDGGRTD